MSLSTFSFAGRSVNRMGYGAMQLAGQHVFGPPKDHDAALAVLREALKLGVDHIDTSDFYGPHVTNQIIREALSPYPKNLLIVTKLGAVRDDQGNWLKADEPEDYARGVEDNLRNLGLESLDVANLRIMGDIHKPSEASIARQVEAAAELQRQGKIRHIGLSNVTSAQIAEARRIVEIVCVQNQYNLIQREDDALVDEMAEAGIAYVPFFPLGGFSPIQSDGLSKIAARLKATPMQVALAWLLHRSPNILLIPGTSSVGHLRENIAAADLVLDADVLAELEGLTQAA